MDNITDSKVDLFASCFDEEKNHKNVNFVYKEPLGRDESYENKHARNLDEYSVSSTSSSCDYSEIISQLIARQLPKDLTVDEVSFETMKDSIKFSRIDSLEDANSLSLRIIPPGPVFHTWWARYGVGIFDGSNNPPHIKDLNYVSRIKEQAERLKQWGIPVFIVYLDRDMQVSELGKMDNLFNDHDNVVMLSVERDLGFLCCIDRYKKINPYDLLDDLRYSICQEFPSVLKSVKAKAKQNSMSGYVDRLDLLQGLSIIYSDIDNTFIRKPLFQLAPFGFRKASVVSNKFTMSNTDHNKADNMTSVHRGYFSHEGDYCQKMPRFGRDYLLNSADSLYQYLLSGNAFDIYNKIEGSLNLRANSIFTSDIGYLSLDIKALDHNVHDVRMFSDYRIDVSSQKLLAAPHGR